MCVEFVYGGCDGNENNFETFEECATTCGGLPDAAFECSADYQCVRANTPICPCDPMDRYDFVAINQMFYQQFESSKPPVACSPCPPLSRAEMTSANFGARCNAGRCEIFDVRDTEYSECTPEVGCELRGGAQCCEDCGVNAGLTALRNGAANDLWVDLGCNELPITCGGGCPQTPPTEATAECIDGRCRVVTP
jgi:hypothetical protein